MEWLTQMPSSMKVVQTVPLQVPRTSKKVLTCFFTLKASSMPGGIISKPNSTHGLSIVIRAVLSKIQNPARFFSMLASFATSEVNGVLFSNLSACSNEKVIAEKFGPTTAAG